MANIGGLARINRLLLMSGGVKFVTILGLASTLCHLNYNPYLSWDWVTSGRWTLQDRWLSYHVKQSTCYDGRAFQ